MSNLTCPKCGGTDYFLSKRNVITGIGGVWGNRGGVKQFPVCKVCDEIMSEEKERPRGRFNNIDITQIVLFFVLIIPYLLGFFGYPLLALVCVNLLVFIIRQILPKSVS
jgi:hypothetical protein